VNPVATMREIGKKFGVCRVARVPARAVDHAVDSQVSSRVSCRIGGSVARGQVCRAPTADTLPGRQSTGGVTEKFSSSSAIWCCNNVTTTVCGAICIHVDSEFPRRTTCAWGLITGYMKPVLKSRVAVLAGSVVGGAGGGLLLLLVDPNTPAALFFQCAAW
jgi:hypothetical protein